MHTREVKYLTRNFNIFNRRCSFGSFYINTKTDIDSLISLNFKWKVLISKVSQLLVRAKERFTYFYDVGSFVKSSKNLAFELLKIEDCLRTNLAKYDLPLQITFSKSWSIISWEWFTVSKYILCLKKVL